MVPGWCVCVNAEDNNDVFSLEIACKLIGETQQKEGIQVVDQNNGK
jgi:hypothetical protein